MVAAAEDFDLDSTFIESQAQTDYVANMETCLGEGFDAIIMVGFLSADATALAASENPDVYFIGIDQVNPDPENLPNYLGVQFREDQAGFLAGALAALTTESGTIAGVYGIDIPPVVKFRNGFEQGARYINPDINVLGVYIDNFLAPDRGAAAAEQFIGEGADVIFGAGGPTGSGGITFAAQNDVKVIGVDQDEYFSTFGGGETPGAENLISSAMKRVDTGAYVPLELLATGEGFPEEGNLVLDAAIEGVGFAPAHDSDVPEEVTDQITEILEMLASGDLDTGVDPASGELLSAEGTAEAPAATEEAS
jgi:basic membrane lipoprotein Med (substrate-binding protein (PBP1-ABC) superfamily)